jgi:hypothetical protein
MPETHAESGGVRTEVLDVVDGEPGVLRGPRAGRHDQAIRPIALTCLGGIHHVVADRDGLGAELAQVLDEVEGERVVVVEDEDLHPMLRRDPGTLLPLAR